MDSKLKKQRSVIKFLLSESEKPCRIFNGCRKVFLKPVYPVQHFIAGFHSLWRTFKCDKPRPGRPAEAEIPTLMAKVRAFVFKDSRVTLQVVAKQFSIDNVSAHQILDEKLGMSKVSAKWVPKQLTED